MGPYRQCNTAPNAPNITIAATKLRTITKATKPTQEIATTYQKEKKKKLPTPVSGRNSIFAMVKYFTPHLPN